MTVKNYMTHHVLHQVICRNVQVHIQLPVYKAHQQATYHL